MARATASPVMPRGVDAGRTIAAFLGTIDDVEVHEALRLACASPPAAALVGGALAHSPFLAGLARADPAFLVDVLHSDPNLLFDEIAREPVVAAWSAADDGALAAALRRFRARVALLVAMADLAGVWALEDVTGALTRCADLTVSGALSWLLREACATGALIVSDPAHPEKDCGFVVLAMGKHGARELNYSSDIDLIALFDPTKARFGPGQSAQKLFVRITQRLAKLMQERTADGYVFRVDLRLRPDPGSTPAAISVASALHYYETVGQTWERSAMIKARPCAGDIAVGDAFLSAIDPFVWRRYLDYAAIADVHAMKRQIHAFRGHEVLAVEGHNIKLGRGGIREIEFFAQTQQLIAGGRHPYLRAPETIAALDRLALSGWIRPETRDALTRSYRFLRQLEHRLQMVADEQTHSLPADRGEVERIARFFGYRSRAGFAKALTAHLAPVEEAYARLFERAPSNAEATEALDFSGETAKGATLTALKTMGFGDPRAAWGLVRGWRGVTHGGLRAFEARERIGEISPALIDALSRTGEPDQGLIAFDRLITRHGQPIELLTLLKTHPDLMELLAQILGSAPRLAELLGRRAHVLDGLLDPAFFGDLPTTEALAKRLAADFARARDDEGVLDRARLFAQEHLFLIGVRVVSGTLSAAGAGVAFSSLAEAVVATLHDAVDASIARAHGRVKGQKTAVVALGKLGSREMTIGSDLDLIVLYDHDREDTASDGPRPLVGGQYFSRFTQRLISALSALTSEGRLYDVDFRLRPSGRSGPVASLLDGFRSYQAEEAWTWEHMALTRARVVAASPGFRDEVSAALRAVLRRRRNRKATLRDIAEMRAAIAVDKGDDQRWSLKYARGGLVDVEFVAQALQLVNAADHPDILDTSTARVIENADRIGLLTPDDAETLRSGWRLMQALTQILRLSLTEVFDPASASAGLKRLLARDAGFPDFATVDAALGEAQTAIRRVFSRVVEA